MLAFFWFASQGEVRSGREVNAERWQEPLAGEIVLLSELAVIPPARSLAVIDGSSVKEPVAGGLDAILASIESSASEDSGAQEVSADGSHKTAISRQAGEDKNWQEGVLDKEEVQQLPFVPEYLHEPEPKLLCVNLGRFDKEKDANDLMEKLQATVGVAAQLKQVTEGLVRYLVYMPPFETRATAKQQQVILRESGIRSSLYYEGELKNGLSLGYFSSRKNAERRHTSLLAAGHMVLLKTIENKVVRYSIEMTSGEASKLSRHFWQDLAEKFPNVERKEVTCSAGDKGALPD